MFILEKRNEIIRLIRFDRPYGTFLLMLPTLWSLFIASSGHPTLKHLAIFIFGSFFMRSAGCVINDMADYRFDAKIARTQTRPLAEGSLNHKGAFYILFCLLTISFLLVLTLNGLTVLLSFIALFFAALYPFAKRFTHLAQCLLGIAFSFGILMAWTAARGEISTTPFLLLTANLFWATGYDTIYALMDKEDDLKIGIKSMAIFIGSSPSIGIGLFFFIVIIFLLLAGRQSQMGALYYAAILFAGMTFLYQTLMLRAPLHRDKLFSLFKAHVYVGSVILLGIILNFYL